MGWILATTGIYSTARGEMGHEKCGRRRWKVTTLARPSDSVRPLRALIEAYARLRYRTMGDNVGYRKSLEINTDCKAHHYALDRLIAMATDRVEFPGLTENAATMRMLALALIDARAETTATAYWLVPQEEWDAIFDEDLAIHFRPHAALTEAGLDELKRLTSAVGGCR